LEVGGWWIVAPQMDVVWCNGTAFQVITDWMRMVRVAKNTGAA
jgi:hypothetical protein